MNEENDTEQLGVDCQACHIPLEAPWIRCAVCRDPHIDLCARCFCNGAELSNHESDHPYRVVILDFPLYEAHWSAAEEIKLLEAIQECGLGNWQTISSRLKSKSETECERHYLTCYVHMSQPPLPEFPDDNSFDRGAPVIFKLSDNPPRPAEHSTLAKEMGGYSATRCDFNQEYNNYMELDICQMTAGGEDLGNERKEDEKYEEKDLRLKIEEKDEEEISHEDKQLYERLNFAVLDVYRNCIFERQRRKQLVKDYGLINMRKWYSALRRRFDNPPLTLEFLRPFMRLFPAITFDKYLESLSLERQLKTQICALQDYRQHGITVLRAAKIFSQLRQQRERTRSIRMSQGLLNDVLNHIKDEGSCQSWLARQAALEGSRKGDRLALPNAARKQAPRLPIEHLIGYDKLNDAEKELCSDVRLVPQAYLDFSHLLKTECNKQGSLKLAQARSLIKIDVNKTRRLYDFLLTQGLINKDPII